MNAKLRFGLLTFSAAVAIVLTLMLGRWQLTRADQKEAIQRAIVQQGELPVLGFAMLSGAEPGVLMQRRVVLTGQWLAEQTVFLDNRPMAGRPGLVVLTPLRLEGAETVVLIQRGWVPRNFMNRSKVPEITTVRGVVEVQGRIVPPPGKLYEFSGAETGRIRQNINATSFSTELGISLVPWTVQQQSTDTDGLLREWPVVSSGVEKHYGYAFQWFALSGLIAILYVWFQIVKRFIIRRSS